MKSYIRFGFILSLLVVYSCTPEEKVEDSIDYSSLTAKEKRMSTNAVAGLETHAELETTLFAAEPMLSNPTNIDIDERGRVWVTEGYNYRNRIHKSNPVKEKGDRILILEDEDGDGQADTSKVFYQGEDINSALGILVLGNKVIVSCSPLVIMLTDTDGDDKADEKEILLTGIEGVQHDHGVHAFVFGPDGKLYFNFGNNGTRLLDKDGNPILDKATGAEINNSGKPFRQGMIFRSDRDGSNIEVLAHNFRNNYEVAVDSYGTLWQSDNDDDGNRGARINYVMEYGNYGYKDEMTGAGWRAPRTGMHDSIPLRHWHQNDPGSMPNLLQTGSGSPTGIVLYEGSLMPGVFRNQMIHSEPGHNVVRSYPVQNDGAGYKAKIVNILKGVNDQWFRPSDVCVAPDGSLMVADWYDPGVGGHGVGDLNRGRIYRVAPKNSKYKIKKQSIATAKDAVESLKSPNMSQRFHAWMKLESMGLEAEDDLVNLWKSENPVFQARALWLLSLLEGKGEEYINQALIHNNSDIRITAIRAARNLGKDIKPLLSQVIKDPSPQVRREIAVALRNDSSVEAEDLWVELALMHTGFDRWYLEALGIGAENKSEGMYQKWISKVGNDWNSQAGRDIIWRLRDDQVLDKLSSLIVNSPEDWEDKLRYFRAFDFHTPEKSNLELLKLIKKENANKDQITLTALFHLTDDFVANNLEIKGLLSASLKNYRGTPEYLSLVSKFKLKSEYNNVFKIAIDSAENQTGVLACKLLVDLGQQEFIVSKMNNSNSRVLADLLGRTNSGGAYGLLRGIIADDKSGADLKKTSLESLSNSRGGQRQIIRIIEAGELPTELEPVAIKIFAASGHEDYRKKASGLLEAPELADGKTFPPISQLVKKEGDAINGEKIFERSCLMCHQVKDKGVDFGPKLTEIGNKLAKSAIYKAILDPAEAVGFGYEGFDVKLKDGTEARGFISSNTEDFVEIKQVGGLVSRFARTDIDSMEEIEGSLMTSMAVAMEEQELVDLVTYLEGLR